MANSNLVLQLLITAKDNASAIISSTFDFLDRTTSATANKIREAFGNLFTGQTFSSASNFEEAMARIQAVMRPMPDQFQALRDKAEQLGRDTRYTATQAAEGLEILAKAGFNSKDAIAAIEPVLNLAQGASLSLAEAAGYVADSLTQFGLQADQAGRVTDVLSKAANSANMTVGDMGQAFKYVGGFASQAGLSIEQTAAVLDTFANAGLRSDMAGTALRDLLQDLNNPASTAREAMFKLGISTNDLFTAVDALKKAGPGATQAIQDFGVRSSGAMFTLVNAGTASINTFKAAIQGAQGYAESSRKIMDDTFKGATFALTSSWEALEIALETPILDPLKRAVKDVSTEMNKFAESGILQTIGADVAKVFDAGGKAVVDFLRKFDWKQIKDGAVGAVETVKTAFLDMVNSVRGSAQTFSDLSTTVFSPLTVAINGYRLALALANGDQEKAAQIQKEIEDQSAAISRTLSGTSAEYARLGKAAAESANQIKSSATSIEDLKSAQDAAAAAVKKLTDEVAAQDEKTAALSEAYTRGEARIEDYSASVKTLWGLQNQLTAAQTTLKMAQEAVNSAQAQSVETARASATQNQETVQTTAAMINATNTAAQSAKNYRIEWSQVGAEIPKVTEAHLKLGAGFADITKSAVDTEAKMADYRAGLSHASDGSYLLTNANATVATGFDALKANVLKANQALAEAKPAYEAAKAAGTLAADQTQRYNTLIHQSQQALGELQQVTANHTALALQGAEAASKQASAVETGNAALAKEAEKYAAVALASGNAYDVGKALEDVQTIALANAQNLVAAKQKEATAYEAAAKASAEQYQAALLNTSLSPETLKVAEQEAIKTQALAVEKRNLATTSQEVFEKLQAETFSMQGVTKAIEAAATAAGNLNSTQRSLTDSQLENEQAALRLAKATGDEAGAAEHAKNSERLHIDQGKEYVDSMQAKADAAQGVVDGLIQQAEADGVVTDEEARGIATAQDLADVKQKQADSAKTLTEAITAEAKATQTLAQAQKDAKESAEQLAAAGNAVNSNWAAANQVLVKTGGNLDALNQAFIKNQETLTRSTPILNGFEEWARRTAVAADTVVTEFNAQKEAVGKATQALEDYTQTGKFTAQTQQALNQEIDLTRGRFALLNNADLSKLQSSIDAAKSKMEALRQASEDALAAAQQALAQEQGDTLEVLRLQQKKDELDLQNKINEAKASGDQEAITNLQQALDLEQQTYDLKVKKAAADQAAAAAASKSTSSSSSSEPSKGTYTLNLNSGGLSLQTTTAADPSAFLSALERSRKVAA